MQNIFLLLGLAIISFSSYLSTDTYAACDTTSVTSECFTVNLSQMDPMGNSHGNISSGQSGIGAFRTVLGRVSDILLFMIPLIAAVSLLIAGYLYIFSAGDSEKATKAKTIIKWNIIAILVGFFSYSIVSIIASFFNT